MFITEAIRGILHNQILLAAVGAWFLAQVLKVPIELARTGQANWSLLVGTGGMPSSHSALVCGLATATGIKEGFTSAPFAVALILATIVSYDAAGIRRAAGKQANVLNQLIDELASGHPLRDEELKEILGHSPVEVLGGAIFGIVVSWALMKV
ncbi:MAG: divergent PAP2 family protein [Chloroflexi bacterium]|nr:divergent PAP2 family protein [Chloroflexota bacterium]